MESLSKHLGSQKGSTSPAIGEVEPLQKKIIIARELTKIHEEVKSGTAVELLEFFKNNPEKIRGEFVVVVSSVVF